MKNTVAYARSRGGTQAAYKKRAVEGLKRRAQHTIPGINPVTRRFLWKLFLVLLPAALLSAVFYYAAQPNTLPLRKLYVNKGLQQIKAELVQNTALPFSRAGLLYIDMDGLRRALKQLPWVKDAFLRRAVPDVLHITIVEQRAAAVWLGEGGERCDADAPRCTLLNDSGEVFYVPQSTLPEGLPLFRGGKDSGGEMLGYYQRMLPALRKSDMTVQNLTRSNRHSWRMVLGNGLPLILGWDTDAAHVQRFLKVYPLVVKGRPRQLIKQVDLRYTNGIAIEWRDGNASVDAWARS